MWAGLEYLKIRRESITKDTREIFSEAPQRFARRTLTSLKILDLMRRSREPSASYDVAMDIEEFRVRGKEMVEYICEFMSNIHTRRVTPDVDPGYLRPLLPSEPPIEPESWDRIMSDVESKIMPGVSMSVNVPREWERTKLRISRETRPEHVSNGIKPRSSIGRNCSDR